MIGPFVFFFSRTVRNRIRVGLGRLRRPRYLIMVAAGLVYLLATFSTFVRSAPPNRPAWGAGAEAMADAELGASVLLAAAAVLPWILPFRGAGVSFRESEIQFLFPAPLARRALLHFRLAKGQLGILFGVAIGGFFLGRGGVLGHPVFGIAGLWIVYTFLALYGMAVSLARTPREKEGRGGAPMRSWIAPVSLLAAIIALSRWLPDLPRDPAVLLRGARELAESDLGAVVLYPFRSLVRPALAPDAGSFFRRLAPAAAWLAIAYLWLASSYMRFETAARRAAEKMFRAGAAELDQRVRRVRPRRAWFRLAPDGPSFVAFFWKNLLAAGRYDRRIVRVAAALVVVAIIGPRLVPESEAVAGAIGAVAAAMALFLLAFGPVVRREDFRADLVHAHLLKSYPARGWEIALGEVLAPAVILSVAECVLLVVAAALLPDAADFELAPAERLFFLLAALVAFPPLTLVGVVVQNAAVLLLPGWLHLGREDRQGIEAMGERMLTSLGMAVALVVAVVPATLAAAAIVLPARRWLGSAALLPGAVVAFGVLAVEAALGIALLGRLFDRFDASDEPATLEP